MRSKGRLLCVGSLAMGLAYLGGCQGDHAEAHADHPAQVEHIEGSDIARVTLTERAMERVDVQTAAVTEHRENGHVQTKVPYSSIVYDAHGHSWVYTSPKPRTFVRQAVDVDRVEGDWAFLREGPAAGTQVASVGVAELYGTEFTVGH